MAAQWIEDFVSCLSGAERENLEIEKAFIIKHSHLPERIFKFRAVNEYSIDNLENGTVWMASPSSYNDPYDCGGTLSYAELSRSTPIQELEKQFISSKANTVLSPDDISQALTSEDPMYALAEKLLKADPQIPDDKIPEMVKVLREATEHVMKPSVEQLVSMIRDSTKICSFCAINNPVLMWSHYAENHRGFCMEYDVSKLHEMAQRMLFPVIYTNSLFDMTKYFSQSIKSGGSFNHTFPLIQALYKAEEWNYEQEWRIVFSAGIMETERSWYIGHPARVHLGAKISSENRDRIVSVCESLSIPVNDMQLSSTKFELTSTPLTA